MPYTNSFDARLRPNRSVYRARPLRRACAPESRTHAASDVRRIPSRSLPQLAVGDVLTLHEVEPKGHATSPKPRYTEASLVKALEEKGLIERHRASGDYRAVSVSLTEEGERFAAEGRRLRDEHMDAVMEHVGIEDMRHLVRILRKVVEFHELDPEATCKSRAEGDEAPCA